MKKGIAWNPVRNFLGSLDRWVLTGFREEGWFYSMVTEWKKATEFQIAAKENPIVNLYM